MHHQVIYFNGIQLNQYYVCGERYSTTIKYQLIQCRVRYFNGALLITTLKGR
jgi:hypothetical protein